jgi:hypothetical protein
MQPAPRHAASGGLLSYGSEQADVFRRAASYVDRTLKGTSPGELPVQAPIKYELVVNLKTAKALGLEVLADEIVGGREPGEVGHGLQVPDDDAWFHSGRSVTRGLGAKKDVYGHRPNVRSLGYLTRGDDRNDVNDPKRTSLHVPPLTKEPKGYASAKTIVHGLLVLIT